MIGFRDWYLPDGETHLQEWMLTVQRVVEGRLTYQYHKYEAALSHCAKRRTAVDVGAHVGLFSFFMARDFQRLHAFEPIARHRECWQANMRQHPNLANTTLYDCALGREHAGVALLPGLASSGDTRVDPTQAGTIRQARLDDFKLTEVDFIKIDCEGYEQFVIEGAAETIARSLPVIMVEQKPGHAQRYGLEEAGGVDVLERMGYFVRWQLSGDFVLTNRRAA